MCAYTSQTPPLCRKVTTATKENMPFPSNAEYTAFHWYPGT